MTDIFEPFAVPPQPVEDFVVPNHNAASVSTVEPKPSVRERLMNNSGRKRADRLAVTEPKQRNDKPLPSYKAGMYVDSIDEFYTMVGMIAMPIHPRFAFTMLGPCKDPTEKDPEPVSVARNCAIAWDAAAAKNKTVQRVLENFTTVTVLGTLLAAHAPLAMAAMAGTKFDPSEALMNMAKRRATEQGMEPPPNE